jgi:ribosome maturation factor RimP
MHMSATIAQIERILDPILASLGLSLWDVEFKKDGPRWLLRVYMDREGTGVTLSDCEAVSRDLGMALDVEEIIHHAYTLEVSSPGLDRSLARPEHYGKCIGSQVRIKTFEAVNGEKIFRGVLRECSGDAIVVETAGGERMTFSLANIAKASLEVVL